MKVIYEPATIDKIDKAINDQILSGTRPIVRIELNTKEFQEVIRTVESNDTHARHTAYVNGYFTYRNIAVQTHKDYK